MGQLPYDPSQRSPEADRGWIPQVLVLGLVLLLLVTLTGGALLVLGQQREIRTLERELGDTRAELAETRRDLEEAREAADAAEDEGEDGEEPRGGLGGLLDGLLEGFGDDLGEEGLRDLLEGFREGLGGGVDPDVVACLAGAMDPEVPVEPIEGDAPAQIAAIAERVEEIRGLSFDGPVDAEFLPPEEFAAEVRRVFEAEYAPEVAEADERILQALGAIPDGMDLRERYLELVSGQAAGFYRPETGEIVVLAQPGGSLDPSAQVTLAHELEHALSDQHHGLPELDAEEDADGARAALSLIEGGATLAMQQFAARSLGMTARLRLGLDPSIAESQAQLESFPHYLRRDLVFPYEDGLAFACGVYAEGGWAAVDDAYGDLPETSAQILWPERWRRGEGAAAPAPPAETPAGWEEEAATSLGAADLLWLFEAPGDDPEAALDDPRERAAAWAGGTVRLVAREDRSAVAVHLVQREGEADLCGSIDAWYRAAHPDATVAPPAGGERLVMTGPDQDAVLRCGDGQVRLGIGPDVGVARALAR